MALILFAFVVRVRDGLPLSASTDFQHNKELQERKQQLKVISKSLNLLPERGIIKGHELHIYFLSSEGVAYLTVCACSLPVAVAFCFLEDLRWEFTASFDNSAVALATRPYPFLEFDSTIQKLKQHYNQSGGPSLGVTLAEVQEELRLSPPQVLTMEEVQLTNGVANGHVDQAAACGMVVFNLSQNNFWYCLLLVDRSLNESSCQPRFLFFFSLTQCHLYLFHSSLKKPLSFTLLTLIFLCNIFLFGLRNVWQLAFHISVACLSTLLSLNRKLLDRATDIGV
uniref:SEC22 homolog C, vesicle trafficking protein n=1 Tax=Astyanax mexicanus TaxID=7994 RepID=A0A3B1J5T6_ASTMX